jgi:hypothetical protein
MIRFAASGTAKTLMPAGKLQRSFALRLSAVLLKKRGQR